MAKINITRLPLPSDDFDRQQQDILIRELENITERMVVLKGDGRIDIDDVPPKVVHNRGRLGMQVLDPGSLIEKLKLPDQAIDFQQLVLDFENKLLLDALTKTDGNRQQAAQLLGLNRTTLVEKIKKRKLEVI